MQEFNLDKVNKFLTILFNETDDIHMTTESNRTVLTVTTSLGHKVYKPKVPFNIKSNGTLGWYDSELNLCLLPIKDNKYLLRKGCGKSKPIRSLHIVF